MGQKKLKRFAEVKTFTNFHEYPQGMAGQWKNFFNNTHPIILELACGKGEYAVGMGRLYAQKNFIGIDLKSNRIWVGAKKALEEQLSNVAFIRTQIDKLPNYFEAGEIEEIWITFPDPQLRTSKAKKRLTHPRFLRLYQKVLKPGGIVHLKTDSPDLYEFTKMVAELYGLKITCDMNDVSAHPHVDDLLKIKTHYEKLDIAGSSRIYYLRFQITGSLPVEKDNQLKEMVREDNTDRRN